MIKFLEKLLGKKEKSPVNLKTAPLNMDPMEAVDAQSIKLEPSQMIVGVGQSIGKQRSHNEDTLFTLNAILAGETGNLPFGIFIVADGMGGHQNGELASGVAARTMANLLVKKLYSPYFSLKPEPISGSLQEIMQSSVQETHQAVLKNAPGGGTTLTAAFVLGEQVTIAHVGDSRLYFIHPDGRMEAITRDHSLVQRLIELGQISREEAVTHPQRNVLYRAIGQSEPFEPDVFTYPMPHPGYLMLCSDGLWGVVPEIDILKIILNASGPANACRDLTDAANRAGGPDNISVVIVQLPN